MFIRATHFFGLLLAVASITACSNLPSGGDAGKPALVREPTNEMLLSDLDALQLHLTTFRCRQIVQLVNHLRHAGKERSLDILNTYYAQHASPPTSIEYQMKVLCVCQLLFQPPSGGWQSPWHNYVREDGREYVTDTSGFTRPSRAKFPQYPLAISMGVPFFLVQDWNLFTGPGLPRLPEEASDCLKLCRQLNIIPADLPTTGYDAAAIHLVQSVRFDELFDSSEVGFKEPIIEYLIILQAIDPENVIARTKVGDEHDR